MSLTRLVIERSPVTDGGLSGLRRLEQLRQLMLYDTRVTNDVRLSLESLEKLSTLDVSWTFVTEDFLEMSTAKRKGIEVIVGPRLPDEDVLAIEKVVQREVFATQQTLRFRRIGANTVEVLAATRDDQLHGYADCFTLDKANEHWDIVSKTHVAR